MTDTINSSEISNNNFESMITFMNQVYHTNQVLNKFGVALPPTVDIQSRIELCRILQMTSSNLTLLNKKLNEVKHVGRIIQLSPTSKSKFSTKEDSILSLSKNSLTISKVQINSENHKNVVANDSFHDYNSKEAAMTLLSLSKCLEVNITAPPHQKSGVIDSKSHEVYQTLHDGFNKNVVEVCKTPQLHPIKYVNVKVDSPLRSYPTSIISITNLTNGNTNNDNVTSLSFTKEEIMKFFGFTNPFSPNCKNLMEWKDVRLKINNIPYIVKEIVQDIIIFVPSIVNS